MSCRIGPRDVPDVLKGSGSNVVWRQPSKRAFKARSVERDAKIDHARVESIVSAIETALAAAEAERIGFSARVDDFWRALR
jgi:hypothetical protein